LVHAPRPAPHEFTGEHSLLSVHVPPVAGALYPEGHEQAYVPGRFMQLPTPHEFTGEHSLLSTQPVPDARPLPL
jgi:hypothetical protein